MTDYTYNQQPALAAEPNNWYASTEEKDVTPVEFIQAAQKGDVAALRRYIAAGGKINVGDKNGWTALHYAVKGRQLKAVAELITLGANPSAETRNGWNPLSIAVKIGHPPLISFLSQVSSRY